MQEQWSVNYFWLPHCSTVILLHVVLQHCCNNPCIGCEAGWEVWGWVKALEALIWASQAPGSTSLNKQAAIHTVFSREVIRPRIVNAAFLAHIETTHPLTYSNGQFWVNGKLSPACFGRKTLTVSIVTIRPRIRDLCTVSQEHQPRDSQDETEAKHFICLTVYSANMRLISMASIPCFTSLSAS